MEKLALADVTHKVKKMKNTIFEQEEQTGKQNVAESDAMIIGLKKLEGKIIEL
jgi:hypothetical protein